MMLRPWVAEEPGELSTTPASTTPASTSLTGRSGSEWCDLRATATLSSLRSSIFPRTRLRPPPAVRTSAVISTMRRRGSAHFRTLRGISVTTWTASATRNGRTRPAHCSRAGIHIAIWQPATRSIGENQDRGSDWFGFTSIQDWSRSQHSLMLEERQITDEDRAHHSAGERRVRLRGPLPALGATASGGLCRNPAPRGVGHRDGGSVRNGGRDLPARHEHLAGHGRRLDQRPKRRYHHHAQRLRTYRGVFHELRMVEDGAAR